MPKKKSFPKDSVCKPCWELKYCPYGSLVEYFPGLNSQDTKQQYQETIRELEENGANTPEEVYEYFEKLCYLDPNANEYIAQFEAEDVSCKIFGHICPVFFHQSPATETKESREYGRYISRRVMLQVVRRDGHICQICRVNVPDTELEFDHIIPVSKGGSSSVENIRVLCTKCNRKKSSSMSEHLR